MRISKLIFYFFVFLFFSVFLFGIFISRYDLQLRKNPFAENHPKYFDYRGVTHILSNYSEGSSPPSEIAEHAENAQLNFLYLTDLNDFDSSHNLFGYNNDVLIFTGKKISILDSHFLLYSKAPIQKMNSLGAAQALTNDFLNRLPTETEAVTVVLAHPFKTGYEWSLPYPDGLNGIEVMNFRHMWQQVSTKTKPSFIWSLFLYIFNPRVALLRLVDDPIAEIELWNKLNQKHKTVGYLGNHATGKIFSLGPLSISFPTYEDSFRFASNHVLLKSELTGVASRDLEKIQSAVSNGNFYFSIDALANPQGFAAYMTTNDHDYIMGSQVPLNKDLKLKVDLPTLNTKRIEIKLYKDGIQQEIFKSAPAEFSITEPGNYRVYVRIRLQLPIPGELRWIPWIYTNHFYVR